ncbi:hypothetical protein [Rouxiella badensis]|jgi:hypothetical protein|uniref:hypothetical protein n=1 Tax=Rouxiella badensis TaxID=1646377 RepID=UPI0003728ABE|nr:hypothetical protein [Rouxiella badensis]MCC3703617.1 hypothetical protein [Rouxiella badensis]MCC3720578.1 hypothetical protein [Rouxiella badensis]MCC3730417.1 hypothetical protein [Rouxiella badensis]MCC3734465.1 hypothetical protein [Rouxiella badensis]MCC3742747.1 hypothetical protein [Rouxiella badensis]
MKLDNDDAFKLASKYMDSQAEQMTDVGYFVKFIEAYLRFEEWLAAEDPIEAAKKAKKPFRVGL